jgi:hypothetical protein
MMTRSSKQDDDDVDTNGRPQNSQQQQNGTSTTTVDDRDDDKYAPKPSVSTAISSSSTMSTATSTSSSKQQQQHRRHGTEPWVYMTLVFIAIVTYCTMPVPLQPHHGEEPSIQHVFYYGWLTAVSTGLGAIPLAFTPKLADYWVGISNGTYTYPPTTAVVPECFSWSFVRYFLLLPPPPFRFGRY